MIENLKKVFYFQIASYFRFFAAIRLQRWNPKIIVVTGSNGKTTLLHMLESQLGSKAKVSHHANSAYGVPFDILDLHRKTMSASEWIALILNAPRNVFKPLPKEKIYVVEADADRPFEGVFLATLLKPDVVLWVSTGRTHSMNFDYLVAGEEFKSVEEAIAYEYGYFLKYCKALAVIDGDSELETEQIGRTKVKVKAIKKSSLQQYSVEKDGTKFVIDKQTYMFKGLLPEEIFLSIAMCKEAMEYLELDFNPKFSHFQLPPGRGTMLSGIKNTVLIDSTYNGNLGSIKAMLAMFDKFPARKKWVIIGDMKELGKEEKEEHETLAHLLNKMDLERVILIGKLVQQYTLPKVKNGKGFNKSPDAAEYIETNIQGGEAILFKGSQSLLIEGLIDPLLRDKKDSHLLPRQTEFWKNQRKKLGFN